MSWLPGLENETVEFHDFFRISMTVGTPCKVYIFLSVSLLMHTFCADSFKGVHIVLVDKFLLQHHLHSHDDLSHDDQQVTWRVKGHILHPSTEDYSFIRHNHSDWAKKLKVRVWTVKGLPQLYMGKHEPYILRMKFSSCIQIDMDIKKGILSRKKATRNHSVTRPRFKLLTLTRNPYMPTETREFQGMYSEHMVKQLKFKVFAYFQHFCWFICL